MNIYLIYLIILAHFFCKQQTQPELYSNLINSLQVETSFTISESDLFFARKDSFYVSGISKIFTSTKKGHLWTEPKVATFSGIYSDSSPFLTSDGSRLFFSSDRPTPDGNTSPNIWMMTKTKSGWSEPMFNPVYNSQKSEYSPTLDKYNNLYFGSYRDGGIGWGDIWVSYFKNGSYQQPENLSGAINSEGGEWGSCISVDGDFIIFEASGRAENITNDGDLYISKKINGIWQKAIHLGTTINSGGSDLSPKIHGNMLYFSSNRHQDEHIQMNNNNVDVYSITLSEVLKFIKE